MDTLVLAHAMAIISHEFYYSTKLHKSYEKSLKLLIEEKRLERWSSLTSEAVIRLVEINPSNAYVDDREALISLVESWRCLWCVFSTNKEPEFKVFVKKFIHVAFLQKKYPPPPV